MANRTTALKLKDSCDTCAASKIRCDKQKPSCGRCERLGYLCFYSPARRTGYAHSRHGNNEAGSKTSNRGTRAIDGRHDADRGHHRLAKSNIPASSEPVSAPLPATNQQTSNASSMQGHEPFVVGSDDSNSQPDRNRRKTTRQPRDSIDESDSRTAETSTRRNSCTEMDSQSSLRRSDCSSVAMEMILQLELLKTRSNLQQEGSRSNQPESGLSRHIPGLPDSEPHDAVRTVIGSLRKLSTILVCPCFERQDVGLLAAAVCMSVLDVYSTIIQQSARKDADAPISRAPVDDLSCVLIADRAFSNRQTDMNHTRPSSRSSASTRYASRSETSLATDEALKELPKVARIILQFMKRFQDSEPENLSPELRKSLGQQLGVQLQALTMEAADFRGLDM